MLKSPALTFSNASTRATLLFFFKNCKWQEQSNQRHSSDNGKRHRSRHNSQWSIQSATIKLFKNSSLLACQPRESNKENAIKARPPFQRGEWHVPTRWRGQVSRNKRWRPPTSRSPPECAPSRIRPPSPPRREDPRHLAGSHVARGVVPASMRTRGHSGPTKETRKQGNSMEAENEMVCSMGSSCANDERDYLSAWLKLQRFWLFNGFCVEGGRREMVMHIRLSTAHWAPSDFIFRPISENNCNFVRSQKLILKKYFIKKFKPGEFTILFFLLNIAMKLERLRCQLFIPLLEVLESFTTRLWMSREALERFLPFCAIELHR